MPHSIQRDAPSLRHLQVKPGIEAPVVQFGEGGTLVLRRHFRHGPEGQWAMLTEPVRLVLWSPIVLDRALTTSGSATSRENHEDDVLR